MRAPTQSIGVAIVLFTVLGGLFVLGESSALAKPRLSDVDTLSADTGQPRNDIAFVLSGAIRLYQILLSSQDLPGCSFEPSCSHFGREAVSRFGFQGVLMTSDRLLRCNGLSTSKYVVDPWTGKALDSVDGSVLWRGNTRTSGLDSTRKDAGVKPKVTAGDIPERNSDSVDHSHLARIRLFGDHLRDEGDYRRAAAEYERFLFLSGSDGAKADSVHFQIGVCLRRAGETAAAERHFEKILAHQGSNGLGCAALRQLVYVDWDRGEHKDAATRLEMKRTSDNPGHQACPTHVPLAVSYLLMGEWANAEAALVQTDKNDVSDDSTLFRNLRSLADEGMRYRPKSILKASLLSAIVPGSGRIWLGRTWDGVFSLIVISLTGWAAGEGFEDGGTRSVQGWLFGGLTLGFYGGNIYGTAIAARNADQTAKAQFRKSIKTLAEEISFGP